MGLLIKKRAYRIFMAIAASCLFIAPETRSEPPPQQGEFRTYQRKFQALKTQFQQLDTEINSKLAEKQRIQLNRRLQPKTEDLYRSLRKLEGYSLKLGIPREKLSKTRHLPPVERTDRTMALLGVALDYTVMLAGQSQRARGARDKDTTGMVLMTLKEIEESLQTMKGEKLRSLLEGRINNEDDD